MKFYVTGRSNNYERVKEVFAQVKQAGHEVVFEWTALPMVKPYCEHATEAAKFAKQGIDGMINADVYIIFAHDDGNGVYTEFGAALASQALQGKPAIYAIGREAQGAAMFNYHPGVDWFDSLEEVFTKIGIG